MAKPICYGDEINLFCEDRLGYVFNFGSSSNNNFLQTYYQQKKDGQFILKDIPDSQVISFEICPKNRYKLSKVYRKALTDKNKAINKGKIIDISKVKSDAESEKRDNDKEKSRIRGQRLRYGQIIQLRHVFTNSYVHISTSRTSTRDKNFMQVHLFDYDDKRAQFKILPRFKVKSEGDLVQSDDQILLESAKSLGQYLHVSTAYVIDDETKSSANELAGNKSRKLCEVNLGVEKAGFILGLFRSYQSVDNNFIKGGSIIRFFHKEQEAYIVADGLYDSPISNQLPQDDVHLRIRQVENSKPKTLFPPTSAITYWQIEHKDGLQIGQEIKWEQPIRIRHLQTRMYLSLDGIGFQKVRLTNNLDARSVFILYPVIVESDMVEYESYARIKHAVSGKWLHAMKETFDKRIFNGDYSDHQRNLDEISKLKWDGGELRQLGAEQTRMDDDAFTLQKVSDVQMNDYNFVCGFAPLLISFIRYVTGLKSNTNINLTLINDVKKSLGQLNKFMFVSGEPDKKRQKLMRNLHIIDLIVYFFKTISKPEYDRLHEQNETRFRDVMNIMLSILLSYMKGDSRKNELYFAQYIHFFDNLQTINRNRKYDASIINKSSEMIIELIRDNRKVVERISKTAILQIISRLSARTEKNFRNLEYLNVICVCDNIPFPETQSFIVDEWLKNEEGVYLTELGSNIDQFQNVDDAKKSNVVFVKTSPDTEWMDLVEFAKQKDTNENFTFLEKQLELFGKLSEGRNDHAIEIITKTRRFLTWQEAFVCLENSKLPDGLRSKYCNLIVKLFVDVGNNRSIVEQIQLTFPFDNVLSNGTKIMEKYLRNLDTISDTERNIITDLQNWIAKFLKSHGSMNYENIGENQLLQQVLNLVKYLIKFGFYSSKHIEQMTIGLVDMMDGRNDGGPSSKSSGNNAAKLYLTEGRFKASKYTKAIVDAKLEAMNVVEVLLTFQFSIRLEKFIALFKKQKNKKINIVERQFTKSMINVALDGIEDIMQSTTIFDPDQFQAIMLDLANYEYDEILTKSMLLLTKFFRSKSDLFELAVQAQVLLTDESIQVNALCHKVIPILLRYGSSKMNQEQSNESVHMINQLVNVCHLENDAEEAHPINQLILVNNGIHEVIFKILEHSVEIEQQHHGHLINVFKGILILLKALIKKNNQNQNYVFHRLEFMLTIKGVDKELAECLTEVFNGNQSTCLKITANHIKKIVDLAAMHQHKAPEYLDTLAAIVKIEELNLPLKRNQDYVVKYLNENFAKSAYVLDTYNQSERLEILRGKMGEGHLSYFMSLVDVLATCCEGENRFIESLCQTILPFHEIMFVVKNELVDNNLKRPFVRYLLWAYLNTGGSFSETEFATGNYDTDIVDWFQSIIDTMQKLIVYVSNNKDTTKLLLKKAPSTSLKLYLKLKQDSALPQGQTDEYNFAYASLHYLFDGVLTFLKIYFAEIYSIGKLSDVIVSALSDSLYKFTDIAYSCITNKNQRDILLGALSTVSMKSNSQKDFNQFMNKLEVDEIQATQGDSLTTFNNHYKEEEHLNKNLNAYAINCKKLTEGKNTIRNQINFPSQNQYTEVGGDEDLPLGEEFQRLVKCFILNTSDSSRKYSNCVKLINHLYISGNKMKETERSKPDLEKLDILCLQILRTIIHNEIVKLDDNWRVEPMRSEKQLNQILSVQDELNKMGALLKTLKHLERSSENVSREYLCFIAVMLFNGCESSQQSFSEYCLNTRDELFFFCLQEKIQKSMITIRERRLLHSQYEDKQKQQQDLSQTLRQGTNIMETSGLNKMQSIEFEEDEEEEETDFGGFKLRSLSKKSNQIEPVNDADDNLDFDLFTLCISEEEKKENGTTIEIKDEGHIELVLRVLASMCDGQNTVLQDYLREQSDNMKSANLVGQTTNFLGILYSSIDKNNIDLLIQTFSALNEFASGNLQNHLVIYSNNIVDFVNHILRAGKYTKFGLHDKIVELRSIIGELIMSIIEENHASTKTLVREVAETLDYEIIEQMAVRCYGITKGINYEEKNISKNSKKIKLKQELQEDYLDVGFKYYFILNRIDEVTRTNRETTDKSPMKKEAFNFYSKSSECIEILKEDELHKARFRVRARDVLREEVKEQLKWNIDRDTQTNKIRELIEWSKDIVDDIYYQRRIQAFPLAAFMIKNWFLVNRIVIILSLIINVIMLSTWTAPGYLPNDYDPSNPLPDNIHDPKPLRADWVRLANYIIGGIHNFFSFIVFLTFFLSNQIRFPDWDWFQDLIGMKFTRKNNNTTAKHRSLLVVDLISFQVFYYVAFLAFSISGTIFYGYFFSFHLVNIVLTNPLLQRVIQAVTRNGKSLLWVALLGIFIMYMFALVAFAFLRSQMNPNGDINLFCKNLAQCSLAVIRFGFIGELPEHLRPQHESEINIETTAPTFIYHIAFNIIITTIGLNIIFGIILDTFSELRDLKWKAEQDMRSFCFICGRESYEFANASVSFERHVKKDHNLWAYIFYFIHLKQTNDNDMTNLELHVHNLLMENNFDFFPVNRAMALSVTDIDERDEKLNRIFEFTKKLLDDREIENNERQKDYVRREQHMWEEEHKQRLSVDRGNETDSIESKQGLGSLSVKVKQSDTSKDY